MAKTILKIKNADINISRRYLQTLFNELQSVYELMDELETKQQILKNREKDVQQRLLRYFNKKGVKFEIDKNKCYELI
mgnify:CR=1 FL=1